jgi:hypothetical protein
VVVVVAQELREAMLLVLWQVQEAQEHCPASLAQQPTMQVVAAAVSEPAAQVEQVDQVVVVLVHWSVILLEVQES